MADIVNDLDKQQQYAHGSKKVSKKEAFTIDFGNDNKTSLQDSFLRFKKARQKEIAKRKKVRRARLKRQKNPKFMEELRKKFINQAKKYFGYPYARKYWPKDSEEYNSKMFLDCCGLVRQVVRDLASDFGFVIGPWNQAYMFDTLPKNVKEEDMKPGDLVFMSGTYVNPNAKNQKHFMTHVEIWLGDGPKTIGARWNNGKVQIWNHYKFEAKSFANTVYYFKSIDTWLKGICKSFCPEHKWKRSKFKPGKKSVFVDKTKTKDGGNKDTDEQQVVEQVEQQTDELADEPGDEPDDYPDDGQGDEDQDQSDDNDDLDDDDEDQELDEQEETTQISTFTFASHATFESGDYFTKNSNKSQDFNSNGLSKDDENDNIRNFSVNQNLRNIKSDKEKKYVDLGREKEGLMKAGCDKSNNARPKGEIKMALIENENDKCYNDLGTQLSETCILSVPSIPTGGD